MNKIIFVTSNSHKLEEAQSILTSFDVKQKSLDIVEIQGNITEVVSHKSQSAFDILGYDCFVEDTSLCFEAWGELPGPYIKPFLQNLKPDGLHKAISNFENKKATAIASLGFMGKKLKKPIIFQGIVHGHITSPRGNSGFEWDQIFIPKGYDTTFAELGMKIKNKISHRKIALEKLQEVLMNYPPQTADDMF